MWMGNEATEMRDIQFKAGFLPGRALFFLEGPDAGHFLRDARETAGMSLKDLAESLGISDRGVLEDIESGATIMPLELMQRQSKLGLAGLKSGEIEGMIFLGSNIMDKNLKAVEWTREWIAKVGKAALK